MKYKMKRLIERLQKVWSFWKLSKNLYDFDYTSILEVERYQIKNVRDRILKDALVEGYEHDVQKMDLVIKLLDMILDSSDSAVELEDYSIDLNKEYKWKQTKYVNTRNAHRFVSSEQVKLIEKGELIFLDDLYEEKKWRLYHKLKEYHMRGWWS